MTAAAQLVRDALDAGGPASIAVLGGAPRHERGRLRLGAARRRPRRPAPRRPARRRAAGRAARAAAGDDRRSGRGRHGRAAGARPEGGAAGPPPPSAPRRRARKRIKILELGPVATGLTRHAWRSIASRPAPSARSRRRSPTTRSPTSSRAGPVVIVAGRANLAESAEAAAARSLRAVLDACPGAKVLPALRRGNVVGALQLGLAPKDDGLDGAGILAAAAEGRIDLLVLLGADPIADCPDADLARRALAGARRVLAVDTFLTESSAAADVVLAAAAFGEKSGTTTNLEGRVTTVGRKVSVAGTARPDWMIAVGARRAARPRRRRRHARLGRRRHRRDRRRRCRPTPASPGGVAGRSRRRARRAGGRRRRLPRADGARERADQLRLSAGAHPQALRPGRDRRPTRRRWRRSPRRRRGARQPTRSRPARSRRGLGGAASWPPAAPSWSRSPPTPGCHEDRCTSRSTSPARRSPTSSTSTHRRPTSGVERL